MILKQAFPETTQGPVFSASQNYFYVNIWKANCILPPNNTALREPHDWVSGKRMNILIKSSAATGAYLLGTGAFPPHRLDNRMPLRRTRNAGNAQTKEQLGREMRQSRLVLFMQQFEKEGLTVTAGQMSAFTASSRPHLCPNNAGFFPPSQHKSVWTS